MSLESANTKPQFGLNEQIIVPVLEVLNTLEEAEGLPQPVLRELAVEAIEGKHLNDPSWLKERVTAIKASLAAKKIQDEHEQQSAKIEVASPANVESQEDLDQVIANHSRWIDQILNQEGQILSGRANLQGANLEEMNFVGKNLSCADFSYAKLANANLAYSNLSRCKFVGADLTGANLSGANLKGANLKDANFEGANLEGTNFEKTSMQPKVVS